MTGRDAGGAGADREGDGAARHDDGRLRRHGDFQNVTFASARPEAAAEHRHEGESSVEVAKRVNAKWMTVVPGRYDVGLEWDYQTANVHRQL